MDFMSNDSFEQSLSEIDGNDFEARRRRKRRGTRKGMRRKTARRAYRR